MRTTLYYDSKMLYFKFEAIRPSLSPRNMSQKLPFLAKIGILEWGLGEDILISNNSRMGHDYNIEEKIRRTLYFTSIMMYDKAYNHISNSIPGSMSQK